MTRPLPPRMSAARWLLVVILAGLALPRSLYAGEFNPDVIRATQLAVTMPEQDKVIKYRATALAKADDSLLILTAAHCLGPDDRGRLLELRQGDRMIRARATTIVRNPAYQKGPDGEIPGCDNALAQLELLDRGPETAAFVAALETATMMFEPVPGPDGQVVPIHCIDQFDKHQQVRAGNFSNPKWLEWGPTYRPIPGDSGSGVFLLRAGGDGGVRPILIGVVTDRSARGGGASVICRRHSWVARALPDPEPAPAPR